MVGSGPKGFAQRLGDISTGANRRASLDGSPASGLDRDTGRGVSALSINRAKIGELALKFGFGIVFRFSELGK